MDRDALERFVNEQDEKNGLNTEDKLISKPSISSACSPQTNNENSFCSSSGGKRPMQLQITPTKTTTNSHPLKNGVESSERGSIVSNGLRRSNTRTRKSLIMPVISQEQENQQSTTPGEVIFNTPLGRKQRVRATSVGSQKSVRSVRSNMGGNELWVGEEGRQAVNLNQGDSCSVSCSDDVLKIEANIDSHNIAISDLLQSLASKELEILERTRKVNDLKKQILYEDGIIHEIELELEELKKKVSQLIDNKVTNDHITYPYNYDGGISNKSMTGNKNESFWTKSVSLLNQFDQIIQGTMDNGLGFVENMEQGEGTESKPEGHHEKSGEKSIWSFVQEFKQGLGLNNLREQFDGNESRTEMNKLSKNVSRKLSDTNMNQSKFVANSIAVLNAGDESVPTKEIEMHRYR